MRRNYESKDGLIITKCPFKDCNIGSLSCRICEYHNGQETKEHYVLCNKEELTGEDIEIIGTFKSFSKKSRWFIDTAKVNGKELTWKQHDYTKGMFLDIFKQVYDRIRVKYYGKKIKLTIKIEIV